MEEVFNNVKTFLKAIGPKILFNVDSLSDLSVSFDIKDLGKNRPEILDLPEKIARQKKIKIIFCIDEFQNINQYGNPQMLQQELRASWQNQHNVAYCLYGSKRYMMRDIFNKSSSPFYRFGQVIILEKIKKEDWIPFFNDSVVFEKSGHRYSEVDPDVKTEFLENKIDSSSSDFFLFLHVFNVALSVRCSP